MYYFAATCLYIMYKVYYSPPTCCIVALSVALLVVAVYHLSPTVLFIKVTTCKILYLLININSTMSSSLRTSSTRTTWSGDQLRQVTSDIHRGRPCDPCLLCKQGNVLKYVHPNSWKISRLRQYEPSLDVQPDSCICRLCRDDTVKLMTNTSCLDGEKMIKKINVSCLIVPIFLQKPHNLLITQDYAICLIFHS